MLESLHNRVPAEPWLYADYMEYGHTPAWDAGH
jgi:hypothetical protein